MYTLEELQEAGLDDFRVFLCQVWDYLKLPKPTPVQLDIAYTLQHGERRMVIEAFRGVGKSWITVAFVLWVLLIDPQKKIMVVSASETHATNFTTFCKQLINGMELLQHLRPHGNQRDSNLAFDVGPANPDLSPSVKSVGITGQLTGSRADLIVPDDIESPKNSYTHGLRERIAELVKEFDSVLKPGGQVLYLGTPQVEDSLYEKMPARGYTVHVWPAEVPTKISSYRGRLAQFIIRMVEKGVPAHTPVEPSRFPATELAERRLSYGTAGFALQFMLDTSPASVEKNPLKLHDLMVQDVDSELGHVRTVWGRDKDSLIQDLPSGGLQGDAYHRPAWKSDEMSKFTETVMFVDPSGRGGDETSYAIVRLLFSQLYLVASGGYVDGFAEATLEGLAAKAARYGVHTILVEPNYGGGMFTSLLKPYVMKVASTRIEDAEWAKGQKEGRILDIMQPIVQSHRLTVSRKVIEEDLPVQQETPKYSLIQQFTRMERTKGALAHEDRLEAVAGACAYFTAKLDRDQEKSHASHKDDLLEQEIERFMEHAFNIGTPTELKWA